MERGDLLFLTLETTVEVTGVAETLREKLLRKATSDGEG